ncbi:hypothetical protein OpiT1DRAFT_02153 [Opitutaceae bacterium TAV1]|nr:hypothetical protein OpiT1DRAFT_02153 [Opitutaceae bacterium TAV1]
MGETLPEVITTLGGQIDALACQQITDPGHPQTGAIVGTITPLTGAGLPSAGATSDFVAACAWHYIASRRTGTPETHTEILPRAIAGMDFLIRSQRPGGLIDLQGANYDSAPDTAFVVQMLVPVLASGSKWRNIDPAWNTLSDRIETFVRRTIPGLISGGFHTPNHRWVIASALALAARFVSGVSDKSVADTVNSLLAEGIDIDSEGTFIERSVGVYDAVCDRSLLFLEAFWPTANAAGAGKAAVANLNFDLYLLNNDGTAETGLSRRQDYGTRSVPLGLASCYLLAGRTKAGAANRATFEETARFLWIRAAANGQTPGVPTLNWLAHALLGTENDDALIPSAPPPPPPSRPAPVTIPAKPLPDFARHFPVNGFWRARRGEFTATIFTDTTRLLHLAFGTAELAGLKISQSYFGVGLFVGDRLDAGTTGGVLRSEGRRNPRRPGYELPLGLPVPKEDWEKLRHTRPLRPIPPPASELEVILLSNTETDGEVLEFVYRTTDGLDNVATQIALDFVPGGVWETADTITRPAAGQVLFLKNGSGRMRYGLDVIEIEGGAHAHTMWAMRDSETAPAHVRVLLTFLTPVEHRFRIKTWHGIP